MRNLKSTQDAENIINRLHSEIEYGGQKSQALKRKYASIVLRLTELKYKLAEYNDLVDDIEQNHGDSRHG